MLIGFAFFFFSGTAFATSPGLTYHGRLLSASGTPITSSAVQFQVQILSAGGTCLLWQEAQTLDLSATSGVFVLGINDGSGVRNDGGAYNFQQIFSNSQTLNCSGGGTYTPTATDGRSMIVYFNDGTFTGWEAAPSQAINYTPKAIDALQVAGYPATSLLRLSDTTVVTTPLTTPQYNQLVALINGNSANGTDIPVVAGSPSSPVQGQMWFNSVTNKVQYYDGTTTQTIGAGSVTGITATLPLSTTGGTTPTLSLAGLSGLGSSNQILGMNNAGSGYEYKTVTGTTNQITVTNASNSITLSTPQSIHAAATPTFANVNLSGLGVNRILMAGSLTTSPLTYDACSVNQILQFGGATWACTTLSTALATTAFLQGGNSFGATANLGTLDANSVNFVTGASGPNPRMTITSAGNVGIGTTSPSQKLNVLGKTVLQPADTGELGLTVLTSSGNNVVRTVGTGNPRFLVGTGADDNNNNLQVSGTAAISGNVGIGTTSPGYMLHIDSSTSTLHVGKSSYSNGSSFDVTTASSVGSTGVQLTLSRMVNDWGTPAVIDFNTNGSTVYSMGLLSSGSFGGSFAIGTSPSDTSPAFVINSSKLVGIGTTSPAGTLDVEGGTASSGNGLPINLVAQNGVQSGNSYGGNIVLQPGLSHGAVSYAGYLNINNGSGNTVVQFAPNSNQISLGQNGVAGTYTIAGSSSAGTSPTNIVIGAGSYTGSTGTSGGYLTLNAGSNTSSTAAGANVNINSGQSSVGYGNVIINSAGGNVGIGSTSPTAALQLKAGTASAGTSPLKFTSGTLMTAPEAGAMEYDGSNLYFTNNTPTRIALATTTGGQTISGNETFSGDMSITGSGTGLSVTNAATIGGVTSITNTTASTSTSTGALVVSGGIGAAGNIYSGGVLAASSGTYALPSHTFTGDTASGMWSPATGALAFSSNAGERMRIISNGNVGIGTTSPAQKLSVVGGAILQNSNGTTADNIYIGDGPGSGYPGIWLGSSATAPTYSNYSFLSDGTGGNLFNAASGQLTRFRIGNNAVVTVGGNGMNIGGPDTGSTADAPSYPFQVHTSSSNFIVNSSGSVGIGTTSPNSKLTVSGTSTYNEGFTSGTLFVSNSASSAEGVDIGFDNTLLSGFIQAGKSGVGYEPLLLNPNGGNVGIGTTSAGVPLDVVGNITTRNAASTNFLTQAASGNGSDSFPHIQMGYTGGYGQGMIDFYTYSGQGLSTPTVRWRGQDTGAYTGKHVFSIAGYGSSNQAPVDIMMIGINGDNGSHAGVGVMAASPKSTFDVAGNVSIGSYGGATAAPTNGLIVSGNVGVGTSSPTAALHVAGITYLAGGVQVKVTNVTSTPYTTLTSDYFICVNNAAATAINLVASPATGTTYIIKDCGGNATTYNITITPAAGNIDGASNYVLNSNRQSLAITYDGTQWEIN